MHQEIGIGMEIEAQGKKGDGDRDKIETKGKEVGGDRDWDRD